MASMKDTLRFLVSSGLMAHDSFSIVTFDHTVDTPLGLTRMDAHGRKQALKTIDSLRTGGSTNLSGGLLKGIAVLLFTDGIANNGLTGREAIISAATGALQEQQC